MKKTKNVPIFSFARLSADVAHNRQMKLTFFKWRIAVVCLQSVLSLYNPICPTLKIVCLKFSLFIRHLIWFDFLFVYFSISFMNHFWRNFISKNRISDCIWLFLILSIWFRFGCSGYEWFWYVRVFIGFFNFLIEWNMKYFQEIPLFMSNINFKSSKSQQITSSYFISIDFQ